MRDLRRRRRERARDPRPRGGGADERAGSSTAAPTTTASSHAGPVALATRRLSIIDLDARPPADRQRGRQRRRRPERRDLQLPRAEARARARRATASPPTATPRSSSTSTRSTATRFVERLRGMFAIALWDDRRRRLLLGPRPLRDQAALLLADVDGGLSFASELKAMLEQPGFSREIDPRGARRLPRLQLDPGAADDLRRGAQAAPGPPARLAGRARSSIGRYARPRPRPRRRGAPRGRRRRSPPSCASVLRDSVRAHLVADVPVGVLLSGGVDSGALTALAAAESASR